MPKIEKGSERGRRMVVSRDRREPESGGMFELVGVAGIEGEDSGEGKKEADGEVAAD